MPAPKLCERIRLVRCKSHPHAVHIRPALFVPLRILLHDVFDIRRVAAEDEGAAPNHNFAGVIGHSGFPRRYPAIAGSQHVAECGIGVLQLEHDCVFCRSLDLIGIDHIEGGAIRSVRCNCANEARLGIFRLDWMAVHGWDVAWKVASGRSFIVQSWHGRL